MTTIKHIGLKKLGQMHIKQSSDSMTVNISFDRLARYMSASQRALDEQVLKDMIPFMPMESGHLVQDTLAMNQPNIGSGELVLDTTEYARFLYHGKLMVHEPTGSSWAPAGETKVVTDIPLSYSKEAHPNAGQEWFERAKEAKKRTWLKVAREAAGKR